MKKVVSAIENSFEDNGKSPLFSFKILTLGLSKMYAGIMRLRAFAYKTGLFKSHRLPFPTLSVGNITAGGTGKTPMTLFLARWFQKKGARVVIVSRGYGGSLSNQGAIVSDGDRILLTAKEAGDEPLMMAQKLPGVPVVIGARRFEAALNACKIFSPDLILLDDAFQHLKVQRDLNLLLADGTHPFGNGHTLPRGPLREPLSALSRAHAVVLTRAGERERAAFERNLPCALSKGENRPVMACSHTLFLTDVKGESVSAEEIGPCFLFSGIAKNHAFEKGAMELGVRSCGFQSFSDHHPYTPSEITAIEEMARKKGATALLTTDKDLVKVEKMVSMPIYTVAVALDISQDHPHLEQLLTPFLPKTSQ